MQAAGQDGASAGADLLLIVNSRRLTLHQREFDRFLQSVQTSVHVEIRRTEYAGHAVEIASSEGPNFPIVAAAGGDGTVGDVASGLLAAQAESLLLPVPFGTGNDFARDMGIRNVDDSVAALRGGSTRALDAIEIQCQHNGAAITRYSIQTAGVAIGAEVMRRTSDRIKRLFGSRGAYSVGLFLSLVNYTAPRLRLRSGERTFDNRMLFVSVGNAEWTGGGTMRMSPGARMDDGLFDVCVFDTTSKLRVVTCFVHILKGTHIDLPEVTYFSATELEVESEPAAELMVDGEAFGWTPATFRIRPQALRVLCQ